MNAITRNEPLNLEPLFTEQQKLDTTIATKKGFEHREKLPQLIRALKTEIAEAVNEWQEFKFWKVNPSPRRESLLEEYVDALHFFLSIGNVLDIPYKHDMVTVHPNIYDQLNALDFELLRVDEPIHWMISFSVFRGLGESWGFTWEEIERAYYEKHEVNYQRQEDGY